MCALCNVILLAIVLIMFVQRCDERSRSGYYSVGFQLWIVSHCQWGCRWKSEVVGLPIPDSSGGTCGPRGLIHYWSRIPYAMFAAAASLS